MEKPAIPSPRSRGWAFALLLVAVTLAAYQPAWNGKPLWDDDINITPAGLRSLDGLARIWGHPGATAQYYPLVHSVFWLEYRLWGSSTLGYHLVNILLHVVSALLLVRILRKLEMRGAWLAGGIFALHPVMVQSVAWMAELKNVLSGVFFLSAALAYLTYLEAGRRRPYGLALALFVLGLLSKTAIAPFPLAMLAVVWWKRGRLSLRRDVLPLLPFLVIGALLGVVTLYVEHTFEGARGREFGYSIVERSLIAGRAFWFYLAKVLLPAKLIFLYPKWTVNVEVWWQYLFPATALMLGIALWALRGYWRAPLAVFLYVTAMLLPVSGFFDISAFRYSFVADHWQYLAAIGPMTMIAWLVDSAIGSVNARGRVARPAISAAVLLTVGIVSWRQSSIYADAQTLYLTTIRENSNSWLAHNNLGVVLANAGRADDAIAHYRRALEINPNYPKAHCNLANALAAVGRMDEAIAHYQTALRLDADYLTAEVNLGNALVQSGRMDDAITHYRRAEEIAPRDDRIHTNLGNALWRTGRRDEAISHYRKAVELAPDRAESRCNLGKALVETEQTDEAITQYRRAVEINPRQIDALRGLGDIMLRAGRAAEAITHYLKALEVAPNEIGTLQNLTLALVQEEQWTDAFAILQRARASARSQSDEERIKEISETVAGLYRLSTMRQ